MGELIWFMLTSHQKRDSFTGVYHNESGEGVRVLIVANSDVLDSYYKLLDVNDHVFRKRNSPPVSLIFAYSDH